MSTPVSGPGQFSKRTDKAVSEANRSLPNADYGEQATYKDQMAGAPLANTGGQPLNFADLFGNPAANVTPLSAESTMPDVPVTDGADAGAGAGSEVLSSSNKVSTDYMASYLTVLEFIANQPGSSDAARNAIRQAKGNL